MEDRRRSLGYPREWAIPARNRRHSNQPGHLAEPEQPMATQASPHEHPASDHMRQMADILREPEPVEDLMDYGEANTPIDPD